jgi:hypothetical protein
MGTPHRGSKLASLATPLSNMINLAILKKRLRTDLLKNLEVSSTTITEISLSATHRLAPLEIVSFYEQKVLEPLGCRVSLTLLMIFFVLITLDCRTFFFHLRTAE